MICNTALSLQRSIVHDVCEVAGLVAYSFGEEDVNRHTVVWKKESAPGEDELACLRAGRKWDPGEHARAKAAEEEARRDGWHERRRRFSQRRPWPPQVEGHCSMRYACRIKGEAGAESISFLWHVW